MVNLYSSSSLPSYPKIILLGYNIGCSHFAFFLFLFQKILAVSDLLFLVSSVDYSVICNSIDTSTLAINCYHHCLVIFFPVEFMIRLRVSYYYPSNWVKPGLHLGL